MHGNQRCITGFSRTRMFSITDSSSNSFARYSGILPTSSNLYPIPDIDADVLVLLLFQYTYDIQQSDYIDQ